MHEYTDGKSHKSNMVTVRKKQNNGIEIVVIHWEIITSMHVFSSLQSCLNKYFICK